MAELGAPGDAGLPSRRSVLASGLGLAGLGLGGVGLGGLGLAGCDASGGSSGGAVRSGGQSPDVRVATAALTEVTAARGVVLSALRGHPPLRTGLADLVAMHRSHAVALADAVPHPPAMAVRPRRTSPRGQARALRRVVAAEQHLQLRLDALALRAQSGEFARLLASMAASVAQHLAVLPS